MTTATSTMLTDSDLYLTTAPSGYPAGLSFGDRRTWFPMSDGGFLFPLTDDLPPWAVEVANELQRLLQLRRGWDGHRAAPIRGENIDSGFQALLAVAGVETPKPHVVPTVTGGVQFEWHSRAHSVEIEVVAPFRLEVLFEDHETGAAEEAEVLSDFTALSEWIRRLA